MEQVTFSIIIASLNAEKTIEETVNSVLSQTVDDYEIIIKDGNSKDNTLSVIPQSEKIKIYSKTDKTVYDGMNQAIKYASGKYLIFMNCGDKFHTSDVLESVKDLILKNNLSGDEVIYGNYFMNGKAYSQVSKIDKKYMLKSGLCHQSVFFGANLIKKYGDYDVEMKICADYDILARLFYNNVPFYYIDKTVCDYLGGGLSEMSENLSLVKKEGDLVRKRYFNLFDRAYYQYTRIINRIGR